MSCIHVCVGGVIYFIAEVRTKLKEEKNTLPCRWRHSGEVVQEKKGFLSNFVAAGAVDDIKRR
jgi:hypothetical protein